MNVGGTNSLPTKDFVRLLESLAFTNIQTYIQTGNAVFRAAKADAARLPARIQTRIQRDLGFAPEVIVLRLDELEKAVTANPYPAADSNPKSLHLTFLAAPPKSPDLAALEKLRRDEEQFSHKGKVFYFYAPDGFARSRAFQRVERSLGVAGTARNWRTVRKLLEMAREIEGS